MDIQNRQTTIKIKLLAAIALLCILSATPAFGDTSPQHQDYYAQALKAVKQHDLKQAITLLDMAIAIDPEDQPAHFLRGTLYLQLNQPKQALADLELSNRTGREWPHLKQKIDLARLQLGKQAFVKGDNQGALVLLQLAIADIPEEFQPLTAYWLSMALQRNHEYGQAIELLSTTLQRHPDTMLRPVLQRHLDKLNRRQKPRDWSLKLQLGIAYDETVGLYPDAYFSPLWPNDQDYRGQVDLESSWRMRHDETSSTTVSYRLFLADYFKLTDYNVAQQALTLDHRMKTQNGNWGWNLQYIDADLGIDGGQNNQLVTLYQIDSPNIRRMTLKKAAIFHNEYAILPNRPYSGDGLSALYRYYFLNKGRNDRSYIGTQVRYYEAFEPLYTNAAYSLDLGFERSWWRLDYGFIISLEGRDYINRPDLNHDEHQLHKIYLAYNLRNNLGVELGIRHVEGDSHYFMSHYGRAIAYLVTRWQP